MSTPPVEQTASAAASRPEVTWIRTGWDDPRTAALSEAMDEELVPRYAELMGEGDAPAPPTADQVAVVVIAEIDGTPAAAGTLRRLGDLWEVKRLYVAPAFRRLGLARRLLAQIEEAVVARGGTEAYLQTGVLQPDAIALYEREGWVRIPAYPPYSDDDGVSVCFRKSLAG
jgi:GNAT superfamily N-acetyltransferase